MCPFREKCIKAFVAGIVAGSLIIESCNSGFHCDYISPHENPKPKYFSQATKDSFTIVASSSGYLQDVGESFIVELGGHDSERPGNTIYFFIPKETTS